MKYKIAILPILLCMHPLFASASDTYDTETSTTRATPIVQNLTTCKDCATQKLDYSQALSVDWTNGKPVLGLTHTDAKMYNEIMDDMAATRARLDELLSHGTASDVTVVNLFNFYKPSIAGCPFTTTLECDIWRKKPIVNEIVIPRSQRINECKLDEIISTMEYYPDMDSKSSVAAPLVDRYKNLMRAGQACCSDGILYSLKQAGAEDDLIYKFLFDDANFYNAGARCLMMTDEDIIDTFGNTKTATMIADVRDGCLCRSREWFNGMLGPFNQVYDAVPVFAEYPFEYTYTDGLNRTVIVSINQDVQNVMSRLEMCP